MSYGILLLRVLVGLAFVGHGTQKLLGWFGGHGPKGTGGFFGSQGYRAPVLMAVAAGLSEAIGGTRSRSGSQRRSPARCWRP